MGIEDLGGTGPPSPLVRTGNWDNTKNAGFNKKEQGSPPRYASIS